MQISTLGLFGLWLQGGLVLTQQLCWWPYACEPKPAFKLGLPLVLPILVPRAHDPSACGRNRELWEQPFQACAIDADYVRPDGQNSVVSFVISKWLLPELSFSDRWSRGTEALGTKLSFTGHNSILGNPGATSRDDAIFSSERYFRAKVYFKCWRAPGNLFLPNQFQKWSNSVPLIGQKNIFLPNQRGALAG